MTARIIRAIEHPLTTMLGHMTGRLLLRRESSKLDAGKIIDAAIANHVAIELMRVHGDSTWIGASGGRRPRRV